jgi:tryptophan-rich hypothetical protein
MTNRVSPKSLLHSKWTRTEVQNKEKHFIIVEVEYDENQQVEKCVIEAVINNNCYDINWRDLKQPAKWKQGWQ